MKKLLLCAVLAAPTLAWADPSLECSLDSSSQVETGNCVGDMETRSQQAMELALSFAMDAATELDDVTGREMAKPALTAGQQAWESYRDAHCEFVGTTFGGGSGTGIAISSCQVELNRARTSDLMRYAQ